MNYTFDLTFFFIKIVMSVFGGKQAIFHFLQFGDVMPTHNTAALNQGNKALPLFCIALYILTLTGELCTSALSFLTFEPSLKVSIL